MSATFVGGEPRPAGGDSVPAPRDFPFRRERTIAILSEGFARGVMGIEEFERRVAEANAARSLGQLDRLIDDVPEELHALSLRKGGTAPDSEGEMGSGRESGAGGRSSRDSYPGSWRRSGSGRDLSEEGQGVYGVMMSRTLRGRWLKSRTVAVRTVMSSTELDFRGVDLPPEEVEVRVGSVMSSVIITVPEGLAVDCEIVPVLGEVKEGHRVRAARGEETPRLRVTGVVVLGEVRIRAR
jgi:hypothetical protein